MAEYYRTVFSIRKRGERGISLLSAAAQAIHDWAMGDFGSNEWNGSDRRWVGENGTLRVRSREIQDFGLAAFRLVWERPDSADPTNRWRLSARLATNGDDVEADIEVLGIETPTGDTRVEYLATLPTIPSNLLDEFVCRIGAIRLTAKATEIATDESTSFVNDCLLSAERQMPLIVVSRDSLGHGIDADRLQEQLIGLAEVVTYDHDTAWDIAKEVPRALRCYDGAIRLYSPGCSDDDVPQQNPYWMPSDEEQLRESNRFWMMLRDECVNRVPTHTRRRLFSSVRNRIRAIQSERQEAELQRLEELEANLESTNELRDEYRQAINDLDRAYDEILKELDDDTPAASAAKKVARSFKNKIAMLEDEVSRLKREIKALKDGVNQSVPTEPNHPEQHGEGISSDYRVNADAGTVIDIVKRASLSRDKLRFLPTAFTSANDSQFQRPDAVGRALEVLDACGKARAEGPLGRNITDWMSERNVDYAAHESESTQERHSDERTFYDPEREVFVHMPAHVKIGGNKLRIHVRWESDAGEWLVGWVGDHLPTARHNS